MADGQVPYESGELNLYNRRCIYQILGGGGREGGGGGEVRGRRGGFMVISLDSGSRCSLSECWPMFPLSVRYPSRIRNRYRRVVGVT